MQPNKAMEADRLERRCLSQPPLRRRLIAKALGGTLVGTDAEAVGDKASPTVPLTWRHRLGNATRRGANHAEALLRSADPLDPSPLAA